MLQEERFIFINDIIKAIRQANLHSTPSPETLKLIAKLESTDLVFTEKIDNFILENRDDRKRILEQVIKINGTVACISKWKERATGALIMMNIFLVPITLHIIYQLLEKSLNRIYALIQMF